MTSLAKPEWLKKRLSLSGERRMKKDLRDLKLHSVCEEASCPNISECFSKGVATVMIMGDVCTRTCKFCNVKSGRPQALDPLEPQNTAEWVKRYELKHVVITSVDRDDLKDLGSTHFAQVICEVRNTNPQVRIEVLTPDFQGREECLKKITDEDIAVFNHNLETIERLTPHVRSASSYSRSLKVISIVKNLQPRLLTKSGLMLGLGETFDDTIKAMRDLHESGCDLLTLGQYLQPSRDHLPVTRYVHPDEFEKLRVLGLEMGFRAVFSGPFVRSSYLADELVESLFLV